MSASILHTNPRRLVNNYYMLCYDQFDKAPSLNYLKVTPSKLTQSANDVYGNLLYKNVTIKPH